MVLEIYPYQLAAIRAHGESTYPDECCGLLIGKLSQNRKTVVEVRATQNVWNAQSAEFFLDDTAATTRSHYTIAPETMLAVQKDTRDRNLAIIGIYHSHPNHPAIPSECDRLYAWQQYSYIIVSVQQGVACDLNNWSLNAQHQFQPEEIIMLK